MPTLCHWQERVSSSGAWVDLVTALASRMWQKRYWVTSEAMSEGTMQLCLAYPPWKHAFGLLNCRWKSLTTLNTLDQRDHKGQGCLGSRSVLAPSTETSHPASWVEELQEDSNPSNHLTATLPHTPSHKHRAIPKFLSHRNCKRENEGS